MKVALVCDWLTNVGGAEKVLLRLHQLYPEAPIYTSKYSPKGIDWFRDAEVKTGWLQIFPAGMRRVLGPLRQRWFSHLKLSGYDLVISVTGAEAKAVRVPDGVHICYCHAPTQYYWQMYDTYVKNPGFGVLNPLVRVCFKILVGPLRKADLKAAQRPDWFVTISEYEREAIRKYYGRESEIIHPPVDVDNFSIRGKKSQEGEAAKQGNKIGNCQIEQGNKIEKKQEGGCAKLVEKYARELGDFDITRAYITTSRQVNWKRIDLAVRAAVMTQRPLLVVGEGPEHAKLVKLAGGSGLVRFLPLQDKAGLAWLLGQARGYLFPSLEPFGIAPVEALSAGCPVIAYGEGGARDYVKDGVDGVTFPKQTAKSLAEAILRFEKIKFSRAKVARTAEGFSVERFDGEIKEFVGEKVGKHK